MKADYNRWWLLPISILTTSALLAFSIIVFQPAFINRSFALVAQRTPSEPVVDCSGTFATDYACYQQRYQQLVRGSGVKAAFDELKDQYQKNQYVKDNCHQIAHVIGRTAFDMYGDLSSTYAQGDNFCWSGYYHGAMESLVAQIGPDKVQDEASSICDDLAKQQKYSFYHYNCVHGLGHGFMGVLDNELFKALQMCDKLNDQWERDSCYSGVFMENVMALRNPSHPPKYLKADEPMYPCTEVDTKYKKECYKMQTSYALDTVDHDFGKVFDLCGQVESDFRSTCYESVGRDASGQSVSDAAKTKDTCMLAPDYEARSNCVVGAVKDFISYYHDDKQAKELCQSFDDADLRDLCLKEADDYYTTFTFNSS